MSMANCQCPPINAFLYNVAFQAVDVAAVAHTFTVFKTKAFLIFVSGNHNSNAVSVPALR